MKFSSQQDSALQSVSHWLQGRDSQVFRLFGYAGTGKTTLAHHFGQDIDGDVLFATYTGKAAHVLQTKGCDDAQTLHSLIYNPKNKSKRRLRELEKKLETFPTGDARGREVVVKMIEEEAKNLTRPSFSLDLDSNLTKAKLLVVDECSMVDKQMGEDILSFGKKVLVLGDPAQLPPVMGGGFFTNQSPDIMLTDIHRQAEDNPIIRLSKDIRNKRVPTLGHYGDSRVVSEIDPEEAKVADQILVGRNNTRFKVNRRIRQLLGIGPGGPVPSDKLVCLRNNRESFLINGAIWNVLEVGEREEEQVMMTLQSDDTDTVVDVLAHTQYFDGEEVPWYCKRDADEFDYGYALTVHKSQGSQWDDVVVIDESSTFRDNWWRWLYTGVTRAAERVTLVRK